MFYNCLILLDFVWQLLLFIILLLLFINIFRLFFIFFPLNWNHPPILAKDHVTILDYFHFSRPAFVAFPVPPSYFFSRWSGPAQYTMNWINSTCSFYFYLHIFHVSHYMLKCLLLRGSAKSKVWKMLNDLLCLVSSYFVKIEIFLLKVL